MLHIIGGKEKLQLNATSNSSLDLVMEGEQVIKDILGPTDILEM